MIRGIFDALKWPLLIISLMILLILSRQIPSTPKLSLEKDAVILAFGDSLTYGYGAVEYAYPLLLERLLSRTVVNEGVTGEISSIGLKRLPGLLQRYHPQVVILCHGGNDILRHQSLQELKANLTKMVILSQESGALVLIVGVPGFSPLGVTTLALYKEVAEAQYTLYEGRVLEEIEQTPALKSDQIHPNAQGYKMMAVSFSRILQNIE